MRERKRIVREDAEVPLSSMIDIVFFTFDIFYSCSEADYREDFTEVRPSIRRQGKSNSRKPGYPEN